MEIPKMITITALSTINTFIIVLESICTYRNHDRRQKQLEVFKIQ
jgi:hypothetical protein